MKPTSEHIQKFQPSIEGPCKATLEKLYPSYMQAYFRFRNRVGPQCPLARGIARNIFLQEYERLKDKFVTRFESGDWSNYE
jgi:hypothetical protein